MTRFAKLLVIGVLGGTLGVVGCSDETTGTGGAGATGGTGGSGGGSMLDACSTGPLATTGQTASAVLICTATLDFGLTLSMNATPVNGLQAGANEFDIQLEVAIDAATVDEVLGLAPGVVADVAAVIGGVDATMGASDPAPTEIVDEGTPCALEFVANTAAVVVTTVEQGTWTLDEGETLELTLESITQEVVALGIPVTLTTEDDVPNEGDMATCQFVGDKPTVQFTAGTGGNGGNGGNGS